ncbi:unnamed protein product [Camellia sinensis]
MPFIFDMVWDLIKLADYLTQREDIDPSKIGITGESLGGMHAYHDKWYGRVDSIKAVFEETRIDLGKSAIDKEVVEQDPTNRPKSIVDVRCGIGGSSRYLARKYEAQCQGITLSPIQAQMAEGLAASQGLANKVSFEVADALNQPFPDAQFPVSILSFQDLLINLKKITNYMKKLEKVSAPLFTGLSAFLCVDWDLGMYPAQNCLCCT